MLVNRSITASFDAGLAREVGIPAAILYNQLTWLAGTKMAQDYDEDGWFYYTAQDFEEDTTYTKNVFTRATDKLVEAGYIEKKKMYKKNTSISVNHFRFLKSYKPVSPLEGNQGVTPGGKPIYKKNNKEEKLGFPSGNTDPSPTFSSLSADGDSRPVQKDAGVDVKITTVDSADQILSAADKAEYNEKTGELTVDVKVSPFSGEVKDVKPKKDMVTPKAFALAKELMPIVDPNDNDVVSTARLIKLALNRGTTPEQLRYVARASRSDDWYYNKPCTTVFRKDGIKDLLAKQKKKEDDNPHGLTKEARAWI